MPLLYDRDCGFCVWSLAWILAWDRDRRLRPVPLQGEEAGRLLSGMARERRMASFHLVTVDGTVLSGGDAAPLLLRLLPGGFVLAGLTTGLPGATRSAYRLVAGHRTWWGRAVSESARARARERIARRA